MTNPNMSLIEAAKNLDSALKDYVTDVKVKTLVDDLFNVEPLPEGRTNAPFPIRLEELGDHNVRAVVTLTAHGVTAQNAAQTLSQIIQQLVGALGD
jgi:hypothetical protein